MSFYEVLMSAIMAVILTIALSPFIIIYGEFMDRLTKGNDSTDDVVS